MVSDTMYITKPNTIPSTLVNPLLKIATINSVFNINQINNPILFFSSDF